MVDQLNAFAFEVTRVAKEVGTRGKAWRAGAGRRRGRHSGANLTENVNELAANLTVQLRDVSGRRNRAIANDET